MVYIDEHIDDFDLPTALADISEQRRQQALRFRHERGQRTCVLAYLLLKKALRDAVRRAYTIINHAVPKA